MDERRSCGRELEGAGRGKGAFGGGKALVENVELDKGLGSNILDDQGVSQDRQMQEATSSWSTSFRADSPYMGIRRKADPPLLRVLLRELLIAESDRMRILMRHRDVDRFLPITNSCRSLEDGLSGYLPSPSAAAPRLPDRGLAHHTPPSCSSGTHHFTFSKTKADAGETFSTYAISDPFLALEVAVGDRECDVVHVDVQGALGKGEGFA